MATATCGIPLAASPKIDTDRLQAMWHMSPSERRAAAQRGSLSLGEMCTWAARHPGEVELVDGEFFFIAALTED